MADTDVERHLATVVPARRRKDAETLLALMRRVTGAEPSMWATMIGFGSYHYRYDSGREGDAPAAAFAPRKSATVVYLPDGIDAHRDALARLGPHTTGVGCLYLRDLDAVDLDVLEEIIASSWSSLAGGSDAPRAKDGEG